jgi:hypothetical protein
MDSAGNERYRIEGYLPKPDFRAQLEMGLARLAFDQKKWSEAEKIYASIAARDPNSAEAPEAVYWAGVSQYQRTHDGGILRETGKRLVENYRNSIWAKKGSVWVS